MSCASPSPEYLPGDPVLVVRIDGPRDKASLYSASDRVLVHGMVGVGREPERTPADLVILLDISEATDEPSGFDVDADGELGVHPGRYLRILKPEDYELHCTDPDDTILAAEIAAAERLIGHLGGDSYGRISLLFFTTDPVSSDEEAPAAETSDEKEADAEDAEETETEEAEAPRVYTGTALILKRLEELGAGDRPMPFSQLGALRTVLATQQSRGNTQRVLTLFAPTPAPPPGASGPAHGVSYESVYGSEALAAAATLRSSGIEVRVFGIGPGGEPPPPALYAFTRAAGASYGGIRMPGQVARLTGGDVVDVVDWLEIENLDSGTGAADVALWGDGSFSGNVLLREGVNRIRVNLDTPVHVVGDSEIVVYFDRLEPKSWELLVDLERTQSRNRELYRLIEREKALRRSQGPKDVGVEVDASEPE